MFKMSLVILSLLLPSVVFAYNKTKNEDLFFMTTENKKTISPNGIEHIKQSEDLILVAYPDPIGKPTIGYGHLILNSENYDVIDIQTANELLVRDLNIAIDCINYNVGVGLNQNQFDSLVSFVYNIGCRNFIESTLLTKLNNRDYDGATSEFKRWVYADGVRLAGLANRRAREQKLFAA